MQSLSDRAGVKWAWLGVLFAASVFAQEPPPLPERDGDVTLPAQEWPYRPGPRTIRVYLRYPGGQLSRIDDRTGLLLSLHNWGGTVFAGAPDPTALARRLNVVAIGVDYLQSGAQASIHDPEPYDFGWLQALDALRALHYVFDRLQASRTPFAGGRIFATGGSGGGNVALMANKLAPRTFTGIVDLCGMPRLTDDIAFGLPGGSDLNARYRREPTSPNYLSVDEQELRFLGHPAHAAAMKARGAAAKIVVVHGVDDRTCPFADAREMVESLQAAGLDVVPHYVDAARVDGTAFQSTGHSLGQRTEIFFRVTDARWTADAPDALTRSGPTDFERREEIVYRTPNGRFVVQFGAGPPVGRFEAEPPPAYADRLDLTYYLDDAGQRQPIRTPADWERRRKHVVAGLRRVVGELPHPARRVPLAVEMQPEERVGRFVRRKLTFASEPGSRVPAWLLVPDGEGRRPAVLCLHQTTSRGKDEPAGLSGPESLQYARALAERGFVTLVPDYPGFGEHKWRLADHPEYVSGTLKAVWDNQRAVDLLQTLPEVDPDRIGVIGHSLGGHNAIFTAVFEPRLRAVVSNCGFTRFPKDDMPSWTGPTYMPRIAREFGNDAARVPFDFPELIAAIAPRAFLACAATRDSDFDVTGVQDSVRGAESIFRLLGQPERLQAHYAAADHSFSEPARQRAFEFLEMSLR